MTIFKTTPSLFDESPEVFFRDIFNNSNRYFQSVLDNNFKISYPVNIIGTKSGIEIEIAAIGLDKKDIKIEIDGDILNVSHTKTETEDASRVYYKHSITNKSFNLAWKVSSCNLNKIEVTLDKGLLKICIPWVEESNKVKQIEIK